MRQSLRFPSSLPSSSHGEKTAGGKSSSGNVLLAATELFAAHSRHDVEEKKIFLELARNLLPSAPVADRRRISSLLSSHPEVPDDLLEQLADDEDPLTAYPALRYSPRLSVDLLLRKVKYGPDSLRKGIANRPSLRESLIDALCTFAGADVIRILLERSDIRLTSAHQARLSHRSDIVANLGLELAGRDALNPDGLMGQFLHLPDQLRAEAIAAAEMTSLVRQAQSPAVATGKHPSAAELRFIDGLIQEALRQNRVGFAELLSQGLGLPHPTCDLLLQEDQGHGLIVALKAVGLYGHETTTVLIRLFGEKIQLAGIRDLLRLHRTLSRGAAGVLVGQWILHDQGAQPAASPRHQPQYEEAGRHRAHTDQTDSRAEALNARDGTGSMPYSSTGND
ncbi:DUF2336 domain-containing protein [Rhodobacterales bacterium]|nr:DUF2336 domain-containing protein [Rhodobacterales bacterium]